MQMSKMERKLMDSYERMKQLQNELKRTMKIAKEMPRKDQVSRKNTCVNLLWMFYSQTRL